jgi:hypothetical protein
MPIGPGVGEAVGDRPGALRNRETGFPKVRVSRDQPFRGVHASVARQMGQPNIAGGFAIHENEHVARQFQTRVHRIDIEE